MKNQPRTLLLLLALTGALATCLRDDFVPLEFITLTCRIQTPLGDELQEITAVTLTGSIQGLSEGEVLEHGFVISSTDGNALPSVDKYEIRQSWPHLSGSTSFDTTFNREALPKAAYFIRAFAYHAISSNLRLVYSETDTIRFEASSRVTMATVQALCDTGTIRAEADLVNRTLEDTFPRYGFVFSKTRETLPIELPPEVSPDIPILPNSGDPFHFEGILTGLQLETEYFIRAIVKKSNGTSIYSAPFAFRMEILDIDEDGLNNPCDNCPKDYNPLQEDRDNDEVGDVCDNCPEGFNPGQEDYDEDSVGDLCDNCPEDFNPGQEDSDNDGIGDACDDCHGNNATGDSDNDGVCDDLDICQGNDATGDSDNDGICDDLDICQGNDATGDSDSDGICNDLDICQGDDATGDSDNDGVCDDLDICQGNDATGDSDNDGVCDDMDICQGNDATGDSDSDGICTDIDNCPDTYNPGQEDSDNDGIGDACDNG